MNRSVEQALTGLVPALNGPLPRELVEIAISLLAQSRSKASVLKQDEEIARGYACAHLACERLKQRLNLPPIIPRPPIPPRAYKKVYGYFDSNLDIGRAAAAPQSQPQTPSKRGRAGNESAASTPQLKRTPGATATTPSRATPRTRATPTPAKKSSTAVAAAAAAAGAEGRDADGDAPAWAMPLIRQLSKALGAPAAPPHVYAGLCSVLKAHNSSSSSSSPSRTRKRRGAAAAEGEEKERIENKDVPPLVAVLLFFAMMRLSRKQVSGAEHQQRRQRAVEVLRGSEVCAGRGEEQLAEAVERLLGEAAGRGWLEMEWYGNIAEGSGLEVNGAGAGDKDVNMEDAGAAGGRSTAGTPRGRRGTTGDGGTGSRSLGMQGGLGTMMQDRVDYLSEAKRLDYVEWKEKIMERVEQIEREDRESGRAMDVSA